MQHLKMLFSSGPYMPHGYCFLWNPGLVGLHVVSDLLIALSYLSISFTLGYFVRKRRDLPFHWMFICFGMFILACGATHAHHGCVDPLARIIIGLPGSIKALTAIPCAAASSTPKYGHLRARLREGWSPLQG